MGRPGRKPGKLSDRQRRFIAEYLIDLNASAAAERAGYSPKTAKSIGCEQLQKPAVAAEIARLQSAQLRKADLSATRVLEELRRLAFSDLSDAVDPVTGALRAMHAIPTDLRAAIAAVKLTKKNLTTGDGIVDDIVEVKLWDKTRALEMLAKHFKLLQDIVRIESTETLVSALQAGRARVAKARKG